MKQKGIADFWKRTGSGPTHEREDRQRLEEETCAKEASQRLALAKRNATVSSPGKKYQKKAPEKTQMKKRCRVTPVPSVSSSACSVLSSVQKTRF